MDSNKFARLILLKIDKAIFGKADISERKKRKSVCELISS